MLRALAKAVGLSLIGRCPGGPAFYRQMTRGHLGTGASHIVKLQRVWPHYTALWQRLCARRLDGARIWIHDGGVTPFSSFAAYLVSGSAGHMTSRHDELMSRYVARAANAALTTELAPPAVRADRHAAVEACRWYRSAREAISALDGRYHRNVAPHAVPLDTASVNLCHSGGALEHYRPEQLAQFLSESFRILKPGAVASHVLDHRDHLVHSDPTIAFAAHLSMPDPIYDRLFSNPLAYHNRLSPTEVADMFSRAGFERIAIRRLTLPGRAFVGDSNVLDGHPGLPRRLLASRFAAISDLDLHTAAAHYLYRKPDRGAL